MHTETVIEKIDFLPKVYQQQIADYVDFLTEKYLKSLHRENANGDDFMQIIEDHENIFSDELKVELDNRYEHFLNHHKEYPDWDDVKHKYIR